MSGIATPDHTVPYGTVLSVDAFPGTSCQATIMLSLWDEIHSPRRGFTCRLKHSFSAISICEEADGKWCASGVIDLICRSKPPNQQIPRTSTIVRTKTILASSLLLAPGHSYNRTRPRARTRTLSSAHFDRWCSIHPWICDTKVDTAFLELCENFGGNAKIGDR